MQPGEEDPRRWRALAVCLCAGFLTLLDVSIVNVALPSIESGLGASSSDCSGYSPGTPLPSGWYSSRRAGSEMPVGAGADP